MDGTTEPQFAIVEQMGHVRFGARVETDESLGVKLLRCTLVCPQPFVRVVHPNTLYALTPCTEEQAARANEAWTVRQLRPALPAPEPAPVAAAANPEDGDECVCGHDRAAHRLIGSGEGSCCATNRAAGGECMCAGFEMVGDDDIPM